MAKRLTAVLLVALALCAASGSAVAKKKPDPDRLPVTRVRDLHYGDVLWWFYQNENFESLTRLSAYEEWGRMPHHNAETQLLLGGLFLELGMHNEAGARFEKLLTPDVPFGVRNRAWFYLAKVWYARGYLDRAETALRKVQGSLAPALEAEKQLLFANVLMRLGRYNEAEQLLAAWHGSDEWTAYARFNLGVALVREGKLAQAEPVLAAVGALSSEKSELLALRDKANLALGFAWLQANEPAKARTVLERVRLSGPFSNKALLGVGWASATLGDNRAALTPWLELHDRNLLDAAVQEAYLAVPYAFAKLGANAQASQYYESAVTSFADETHRIDDAIGRIRGGTLLDAIIAQEAKAGTYGWFWQLKQLPDAPETRYLYTILAGHDFQEGLKNYRDLVFLDHRLEVWSENFPAYESMLDARQRAFTQRLPRADELIAQKGADILQQKRAALQTQLDDAERTGDFAALGTAEERGQWERIKNVEQALTGAPDNEQNAALRERLRLVRGALQWRLREANQGRIYHERRSLRDIDGLLAETQLRWQRLADIRQSIPDNTGEFAARVVAAKAKLDALRARMVLARSAQNALLAQLAVTELEAQKARIATYELQARFALATIYDRAASAPAGKGAPPASTEAPASGPGPGRAAAPAPEAPKP